MPVFRDGTRVYFGKDCLCDPIEQSSLEIVLAVRESHTTSCVFEQIRQCETFPLNRQVETRSRYIYAGGVLGHVGRVGGEREGGTRRARDVHLRETHLVQFEDFAFRFLCKPRGLVSQ